jgi:hypothetical protein
MRKTTQFGNEQHTHPPACELGCVDAAADDDADDSTGFDKWPEAIQIGWLLS